MSTIMLVLYICVPVVVIALIVTAVCCCFKAKKTAEVHQAEPLIETETPGYAVN
jgi:flagellar biosynthesis protein FliQ